MRRKLSISSAPFRPTVSRSGTPAAKMSNQIPPAVKQERAQRLAELEKTLRQEYFQSQIGKNVCILAERFKDGFVTGCTERYISVRVPGSELNCGSFMKKVLLPKDLELTQ